MTKRRLGASPRRDNPILHRCNSSVDHLAMTARWSSRTPMYSLGLQITVLVPSGRVCRNRPRCSPYAM
jgi:hypothetical protein